MFASSKETGRKNVGPMYHAKTYHVSSLYCGTARRHARKDIDMIHDKEIWFETFVCIKKCSR